MASYDVAINLCQTIMRGLTYTTSQFFETGEPVGYTIELSSRQGLTPVHFSSLRQPFLVAEYTLCIGHRNHSTFLWKRAPVELKSGRVYAPGTRPTANVTMTLAPRISTDDNLLPTSGAATECRGSPYWCRTAAIKAQSPDVASFVTVTPSTVTFREGQQEVFTFLVGFAIPVTGGPQVVDGQVTGDVPIELVATSVSSDSAYGGRESIVDVLTGDEDEPGFVTDGGENTLLQEAGPGRCCSHAL